MIPMDHPLFALIAPIAMAGAIIATMQFFLTGKNLLALFKKLRTRIATSTPVVVVASPPAPAPSPALTPITGPIFFDGIWYGSIEKAAGYLGLTPATIEAAVRPDSSAHADAFWKDTGPIALSHRVLKLGKTRSRVFVREYTDHQTAYVRRKDGRFPIHGRFNRGPQGDEAILRLASAI